MVKTCPNCGSRVYKLGCVNCNETAYIEEQEQFTDALHGPASGARAEIQPLRSSQSTGASTAAFDAAHGLRTENGRRLHDQHCAWCDCEEFVAVRYGSLHHLSERAARAVKAVVAVVENVHCPECGSPEKRSGCVTCADGW